MVMFINPAYDLNFGIIIGEFDERMNLYRRLEKKGVGNFCYESILWWQVT